MGEGDWRRKEKINFAPTYTSPRVRPLTGVLRLPCSCMKLKMLLRRHRQKFGGAGESARATLYISTSRQVFHSSSTNNFLILGNTVNIATLQQYVPMEHCLLITAGAQQLALPRLWNVPVD